MGRAQQDWQAAVMRNLQADVDFRVLMTLLARTLIRGEDGRGAPLAVD